MHLYRHGAFRLESGVELPELTIAYHTYGTLSPSHDNVIWVCHALTANSDVADWWPHTVEEGRFLDPANHFIVCANILGHLLITFRFNIASWVKPGGTLVLAGILNRDFDLVSKSFTELGFYEVERETDGEWTGGLFIR